MLDMKLFGPEVFDWTALEAWSLRLKGGAVPHAADIVSLASKYQVHPALVTAIPTLESGDWRGLHPNGSGDDGHGWGDWQIDDRSHQAWLKANNFRDFAAAGDYAIGSILVPAHQFAIDHAVAEPLASRFAIAGYNGGIEGAYHSLKTSGDPNNATWESKYLPAIYSRMEPLL